jgi:hypothetical protein
VYGLLVVEVAFNYIYFFFMLSYFIFLPLYIFIFLTKYFFKLTRVDFYFLNVSYMKLTYILGSGLVKLTRVDLKKYLVKKIKIYKGRKIK